MLAMLIRGMDGFNPHSPLHSYSHLKLTCELVNLEEAVHFPEILTLT